MWTGTADRKLQIEALLLLEAAFQTGGLALQFAVKTLTKHANYPTANVYNLSCLWYAWALDSLLYMPQWFPPQSKHPGEAHFEFHCQLFSTHIPIYPCFLSIKQIIFDGHRLKTTLSKEDRPPPQGKVRPHNYRLKCLSAESIEITH